jgi:hypothetical protein
MEINKNGPLNGRKAVEMRLTDSRLAGQGISTFFRYRRREAESWGRKGRQTEN